MRRYERYVNTSKATSGESFEGQCTNRESRDACGKSWTRKQTGVGVLCAAQKPRLLGCWKPVNNTDNKSSFSCRRRGEIQQLPNKQKACRMDGQMNGRIDILILLDPFRFMCHVFEGKGSHFWRDLHLSSSMLHPVKAGSLSELASDVKR